MQIYSTIESIRGYLQEQRKHGKTIGLVPTMGYLHQGHLSLMERARQECDVVVISIFVNPTQFGEGEDFDEYPRDLERDAGLAESVGVDAIFAPPVEEMYPGGYCTYVNVEKLTDVMCGASRPGHFRGVCTVVSKLFNIIQPHKAFFGQKDAQQAIVIKRMVKDLNIPVEVITCPIVREEDGLAMSSRNVYLNPRERKAALVLSRSLALARQMIKQGERDRRKVQEAMQNLIEQEPLAKIDYIAIREGENLAEIDDLHGKVLIALAVRIGKTRLIDNMQMEV